MKVQFRILVLFSVFGLLTTHPVHAQTTPSLLWATYFGGDSTTEADGIVRDSFGNIYITGGTNSPNRIATSGAYQTTVDSLGGAFLAKFSPSGSLIWATYYGADNNGDAIAIDKSGNIFISGRTYNASGLATNGAYQTTGDSVNGSVFLAKFSPNDSLIWSTYYGVSDYDISASVATDVSGNVYITGATFSTSGMATKGAYQTKGDSVNGDVFLAKFSSSGSLLWGTYYGDSGQDIAYSIAVNDTNIYIAGLRYR